MTETRDVTRWRKRAWVALQIVLFAAAVVFLVRLTRDYWDTIASYRFSIRWTLIVAASLLWTISFAFLVRLWGRSLEWWQARSLALWPALRVFVVSNLARYVPGAVWQFAGLAVMAVAEGISPLAAGSAVLLQQLALLATGILLTIVLAPGLVGEWAVPASALIVAGVAAAAVLAVLLWSPLRSRFADRLGGRAILPEPGGGPLVRYLAQVTVAWVGYAVAFWLFGRALLGAAAPAIILAGTAYVASYVAGIVAVFAPGGIVVREAALIATLGPVIGADRALVLALAARLWHVALEITVAGLFFGVERIVRGRGANRLGSLRP